jgi:hypothetical protein
LFASEWYFGMIVFSRSRHGLPAGMLISPSAKSSARIVSSETRGLRNRTDSSPPVMIGSPPPAAQIAFKLFQLLPGS